MKLKYLLVVLLTYFSFDCFSTDIYSNGSGGGDWGLGASWAGGVIPGIGDQAFVVSGDNITVSSNTSVTNFILNDNNSTLTVNNGIALTLTDWFYVNATGNSQTINIVNNGTISCSRFTVKDFAKLSFAVNISGSGSISSSTYSEFIASSSGMVVTCANPISVGTKFTVEGGAISFILQDSISCSTLFVFGTNATLNLSNNAARLNILNTLSYSSGNITSNSSSTSKVYFNGISSITDNANISWPELTFIGSCSIGADITANSITVNNSATLTTGTNNVTTSGNFTNNGTYTVSTGSKLTLNGAAAQTITSSTALSLAELGIENTVGGVTIASGSSNIQVANQISFDAVGSTAFTTNGKLILLDEGSGMANLGNLNSHTMSGNITCQFKTNTLTDIGYRSVSMPVSGVTIGDIQYHASTQTGGFETYGFTGSNTPSAGGTFSTYTYNNTNVTNAFDDAWVGATNSTNSLGHQQATSFYIGPGSFGGATSYSFEVSGTPNTGVPAAVTISAANGANMAYDAGKAADLNYNWCLVGNPYPSTIDFGAVTRSNVEATAYIFKEDGSGWTADATIPPFQGFMVRTDGSSASITIEEADKLTTQTVFQKSLQENDFLEIFLSSDQTTKYSYGKIQFNSQASSAYVKNEDAHRIVNPWPWPNMAIMSSDGEALQHYLGPKNLGHAVIPINTTTYKSGNHMLRFENLDKIEGCIVLEDMTSSKLIPIDAKNKTYSFFLSDSVKADRFKLHVYNFAKEVSTTHSTCFGKNDGGAELDLFDFGSSYFYELVNESGASIAVSFNATGKKSFANLAPSKYTLKVSSNGLKCPEVKEYFTILEPTEMTSSFDFKGNSLVFYNDKEISFENNSTGGIASYNWDFGDGNFDIKKDPTHTYSEPGIYTIKLTTQNGNSDCNVSFEKEINVIDAYVGIDEQTGEKVRISQNSNELKVISEIDFDQYQIIDLSGKTMLQGNVENYKELNVNISGLNSGIYLFRMNGNSEPYTLKFYKK